MGRKKKFVEIDEKYVDQTKHQMVTYIIGKAYMTKNFFNETYKKILSYVDRKKKARFPREVKKKFVSNKNSSPPPPDIKWCVPNCDGGLQPATECLVKVGLIYLFISGRMVTKIHNELLFFYRFIQ